MLDSAASPQEHRRFLVLSAFLACELGSLTLDPSTEAFGLFHFVIVGVVDSRAGAPCWARWVAGCCSSVWIFRSNPLGGLEEGSPPS